MSTPTTVFIDTSILDESAYNFDSAKMRAFIDAAKAKEITLLLPDPTLREINRHIRDRANDVVAALKDAQRKAPFLKKWPEWPLRRHEYALNRELYGIAQKEWDEFLRNFEVVSLDYSDVKLSKIMDWYDAQRAPFGEGAKRKEFPDAFAFEMILQYSAKNKCAVAIIAKDSDFRRAAHSHPDILHFDSVTSYTEALLVSDSRVEAIRTAIASDKATLETAISEIFPDRGFYPTEDASGDVEDVECDSVTLDDIKVIAIGENEATVAFDATVDYSAYVKYDDADSAIVDSSEGIYIPIHKKAGSISETTEISGTAKISMKDEWKAVSKIDFISLDEDDIEVMTVPDGYEDESEYYDE